VAVAELFVDGVMTTRKTVWFAHAKDLALTDPGLEARLDDDGGILVSAKSLARGVWVELDGIDAVLSDNAFDLAAGDTVRLTLDRPVPVAELRRALSVRSFFGSTEGTR
jgi:beta-mannosidase